VINISGLFGNYFPERPVVDRQKSYGFAKNLFRKEEKCLILRTIAGESNNLINGR